MDRSSCRSKKQYELDCQLLHYYISGNSALNSQKLVEVLLQRKCNDFKVICQTYVALYGQDLLHVLSLAQRNNPFARAAYLRMSEPHVRDAEIMRKSLIEGNLNTLIEITCTRSSPELMCIKQTYRSRYNSDPDHDAFTKINGPYREIVLAVLKSCRNYGGKVDMSMAMCDAKTLYEAIESGRTIDQKTILSVLSQRNTGQLRAITASFKQLYGHEFSKSIKQSKCGQFGKQLRIAIRCMQNPEKFFAKLLRMKSTGDSRELLIRIVVTRSGIDLTSINQVFAAKTGSSIENLVRREFNNYNNSKNKTNDIIVSTLLLGLIKG